MTVQSILSLLALGALLGACQPGLITAGSVNDTDAAPATLDAAPVGDAGAAGDDGPVPDAAVGADAAPASRDAAPVETDAGRPRPLAPCDFDGDGLSDVGLFDHADGRWHITASGGSARPAMGWSGGPNAPVPAEYDGDGSVDQAVYHPHTGLWHIDSSVHGWDARTPVAVGPPHAFPAPADYDGDGRAELAVYEHRSETWYTRPFGDRDGAPQEVVFGLPLAVPVPADFDGDGRADRAVYQPRRQQWRIQRSSDGQVQAFEFGSQSGRVVAGDYDGDGRADVASFNPKTGQWQIRLTATGASPAWAPVSIAEGVGGVPVHVDLDGDQIADPAVVVAESGRLVARLSGDGRVETFALPHRQGRPLCPAPLDYRGGSVVSAVGAPSTIRDDPDARALAITFDRLEQPHVMTDRNDNPGLNLYSRIAGSWRAIEPVIQKEDHGPMYPAPHIDADDRLWFSSGVFRANDTDATSAWVGMMSDVTSAPSLRWSHKIDSWVTFGGRLAIDPFVPGRAWHVTSGAPYQVRAFDETGFVGGDGTVNLSLGTRTIDFMIAEVQGGRAEGVRHIAHGVSYEGPGKSIRPSYWNSAMAGQVVWNQQLRSDGIDSDSTNASLGLDETDPQVAFMAAFTDSLKVNIWDGARLVFGDAASVADPAPAFLGNGVAYFGPQWTHAAHGGAFLCWTDAQNQIRLQHFDVQGTRTPEVAAVVGPGRQCDLTTDFRGDLHLVYIDGGLRYRVVHTRGH